jgi:7,8-dihydropterin-6-yl-methyl-4-(beta-D-ribofuranosyl)aminobenzene 5'-phosphate synthase
MPTIIEVYNNTPYLDMLTPDWGFSCLLQEENLLFDTGAKGDLLTANMRTLGIDPERIRYLVLSHDHWDHIGGMDALLTRNPSVEVFIHDAFSDETVRRIRAYTTPHVIKEWTEITGDIALTGPLGTGIREQSLAIGTPGGYLIVTGCAHPQISRIIYRVSREGPVWGVIGGLHTVSDEDIEALGRTTYLSASHCTDRIDDIRRMYPASFRPGGAGRVHRI